MLLSEENETIIPAINSFLGTTQVEGKVMHAVAAVVSATAPLFVLILLSTSDCQRVNRGRGKGIIVLDDSRNREKLQNLSWFSLRSNGLGF